MITGLHVLFYSTNPDADREFVRDVLQFASVDVGGGWLIFELPPAEAAFHPTDGEEFVQAHAGHRLLGSIAYLMCDDVHATVKWLASKNVVCSEVETAPWGLKTTIPLPSGAELGLYQPTHETALGLTRR